LLIKHFGRPGGSVDGGGAYCRCPVLRKIVINLTAKDCIKKIMAVNIKNYQRDKYGIYSSIHSTIFMTVTFLTYFFIHQLKFYSAAFYL
jgi:hypothetical protein